LIELELTTCTDKLRVTGESEAWWDGRH